MSLSKRWMVLAASAVVAGGVTAGLAVVSPGSSASGHTTAANCLTFTGREQVQKMSVQGKVIPPTPGDSIAFVDKITSSDGRSGTAVGSTTIGSVQPTVLTLASYEYRLPGGTVRQDAFFDAVKAETPGVWVTLPAVGTGGKYQGTVGTVAFQRLSGPSQVPTENTFALKINLCH
ncbi:MAG: allene oxide cyclase barrel-like domain-containing protein [Mycobacteriales bacterium]